MKRSPLSALFVLAAVLSPARAQVSPGRECHLTGMYDDFNDPNFPAGYPRKKHIDVADTRQRQQAHLKRNGKPTTYDNPLTGTQELDSYLVIPGPDKRADDPICPKEIWDYLANSQRPEIAQMRQFFSEGANSFGKQINALYQMQAEFTALDRAVDQAHQAAKAYKDKCAPLANLQTLRVDNPSAVGGLFAPCIQTEGIPLPTSQPTNGNYADMGGSPVWGGSLYAGGEGPSTVSGALFAVARTNIVARELGAVNGHLFDADGLENLLPNSGGPSDGYRAFNIRHASELWAQKKSDCGSPNATPAISRALCVIDPEAGDELRRDFASVRNLLNQINEYVVTGDPTIALPAGCPTTSFKPSNAGQDYRGVNPPCAPRSGTVQKLVTALENGLKPRAPTVSTAQTDKRTASLMKQFDGLLKGLNPGAGPAASGDAGSAPSKGNFGITDDYNWGTGAAAPPQSQPNAKTAPAVYGGAGITTDYDWGSGGPPPPSKKKTDLALPPPPPPQ